MKKLLRGISLLLMLTVMLAGCGKTSPQVSESPATEAPKTPREGLQTILIFCVDQQEAPEDASAYRNGKRVNLILVMVMDTQQQTTRVLQINPDTVISYTPAGTQEALEISLGQVYSYGSGGSDSGLGQMKEVSRFLGGVPMDHYLTFTMESVAIVNDSVGGVRIALPEDMRQHYPENQTGEEVTLSGEKVLAYLRYREAADISNEIHMDRQRGYMLELFPRLFEKAQDEDYLTKLTLQLGEGMATDLTLSQMVEVLDLMGSYELDKTAVTLPGEGKLESGEYRFAVDEKALQQTLEELFY